MSTADTSLAAFCDICDRMIIDGRGQLLADLWNSTDGDTLCGECVDD